MIVNPEIDFWRIFAAPLYGLAHCRPVAQDAPLSPGACIKVPCPSFTDIYMTHEEVPPATEATEGTCTCHML